MSIWPSLMPLHVAQLAIVAFLLQFFQEARPCEGRDVPTARQVKAIEYLDSLEVMAIDAEGFRFALGDAPRPETREVLLLASGDVPFSAIRRALAFARARRYVVHFGAVGRFAFAQPY